MMLLGYSANCGFDNNRSFGGAKYLQCFSIMVYL